MAADRFPAHVELAVVHRDHAGAVYGLARRVCGPALAADVTQEVFLSYWRRPERFDPTRSSLRSFLLTITYRRAIDTLRSENARRHREALTTRCPDVIPDAHQQLVERERSATIAGAMAALSPLERQAVVAAFYGDRTYREVAQALGVPLGTIKSRIRSGLAKLHDALGELRFQARDEAA